MGRGIDVRHLPMIAAVMSLAVPVWVPLASARAAAVGWPVYANARYGYRICYPAKLLKPRAEAPNGDGRQFTGAGGAVLRVWGSYNVMGESVAASAADARARLSERGKVTYAVVKPGWFVLSGRQDGQIFYLKSVLVGETFSTMELRYPAAQAAAWSPVTTRLSRCFAAG